MGLDAAIAAVLLLYSGIGWWRGFLSQFVGFAAIAAAWLLAPFAAPMVASVLFSAHAAHTTEIRVASVLVAALLIVVAVYALVRMLPEALIDRSTLLKRVNRGAGAVTGCGRGLATLYLLLCAVAWLEPGLRARFSGTAQVLSESVAMDVVRRNNLLITMRADDLDGLRKDLFVADADQGPESPAQVKQRAKALALRAVKTSRRYHPSSF
jgi:uncharacterized membrane protein required for colicin V production